MDYTHSSHTPVPPQDSATPLGTIDVTYQNLLDSSNTSLRGSGMLAVFAEEPRYRFVGKYRSSKPGELTCAFASSQIHNVRLKNNSRKVTFFTTVGAPAGESRSFVFYCATPEAALRAARALPRSVDVVSESWKGLHKNLAAVSDAPNPWTSVTNAIVALNVIVFVIMGLFGAGWISTASMAPYVNYVANRGDATTDGEWWRLLTNIFVHYGVLHLAMNMWALYKVGHFVERLFGRAAFLFLYLGCGLSASLVSIYWHGDKVWSAGASGAVFGVYGLLFGFIRREKTSIPAPILKPLTQSTLAFAGYNLLFGFAIPQIDNAAHIGGLLTGAVLGWLMALPLDRARREQLKARRSLLTASIFAVVFALGIIFVPRYPSSFREQRQLTKIALSFSPKEEVLSKKTLLLENQANDKPGQDALAAWLEGASLPFYADFRRELLAISFDPSKSTYATAKKTVAEIDLIVARQTEWLKNYRTAQDQAPAAPESAR